MSFNLALIGLGQKGDTRRAFSAVVTSNYFSVLGVPLVRGRPFLGGRGNARPQRAGRDRQLQFTGQSMTSTQACSVLTY